jgi:hypothetical protein
MSGNIRSLARTSEVRVEAPGTALYRRFVRLFLPVRFRERYGDELVWVFNELNTEARSRRGFRGQATLWCREVPALLRLTWGVRRRRDATAVEKAPEQEQTLRRWPTSYLSCGDRHHRRRQLPCGIGRAILPYSGIPFYGRQPVMGSAFLSSERDPEASRAFSEHTPHPCSSPGLPPSCFSQ